MTQLDWPQPIYFYAPDRATHAYFQQDRTELVKQCSSSFTTWVVSTYLLLRQAGFACQVVDQIPAAGIVLADRATLGNRYPYLADAMLICAKSDKEFHPSAHLHVVHNPVDFKATQHSIWGSHYIPHWPQPGLIPRLPARGTAVETIAFMGVPANLAPELLSEQWQTALQELGCCWQPLFGSQQWCDYSQIDAIVAVRSFDGRGYEHKPPSKLINGWQTGVPAILAPETAFMALRQSELDFLPVTSLEQTLEAVQRLKQQPDLYSAMVENGLKRAIAFSEAAITEAWVKFFEQVAFPEYAYWQTLPDAIRRLQFAHRWATLKLHRAGNALAIRRP